MRKIISHFKENWIRYGFETFVVVIGILGAYTLNNWNEERKNRLLETEILSNIYNSLQTDSIQIVKIISDLSASMKAQSTIIINTHDKLIESYNVEELLFDFSRGVLSFFPKKSVYNSLLSNNKLQVIRSSEIKYRLRELYDFEYQRYSNIDFIIDHKFNYSFIEIYRGKLQFFPASSFGYFDLPKELKNELDPSLFRENYDELQAVARDIVQLTSSANASLRNIQNELNILLELIRPKIKKLVDNIR